MDWLAGEFTADELAAEDLILHRVCSALKADDKLKRLFGPRIEVQPLLHRPEIAALPELIVTAFAMTPTPAPGTQKGAARIFIVARFELPNRGLQRPATAGLPSLFRWIENVLMAPGVKFLNQEINGRTVPLVSRSMAGPRSAQPYPPIGDAIIFAGQMEWQYEYLVDPETGRFRNLVNAGG